MNTTYIVAAVAAVIVILFAFRFYLTHKKAPVTKIVKSGIDIHALIDALGGSSNISNIESSMSKVTCQLKSAKQINVEAIKQLGATGIVQNQQKLSMIFGKASEAIAIELKDSIQ